MGIICTVREHFAIESFRVVFLFFVTGLTYNVLVWHSPELGYGESGHPPDIPGHAVLLFTLEMVAVDCEQKFPALKCYIDDRDGCNERETQYLDKTASWTIEKKQSELERLGKILAEDTQLKEDLKEWVIRREYLLKQQLLMADGDAVSSSNPDEL